MVPTLSSLIALEVVKTTSSATSDEKVGIMKTQQFFSALLTQLGCDMAIIDPVRYMKPKITNFWSFLSSYV